MEPSKPIFPASLHPTYAWLDGRHRAAIVAHLTRLEARARTRRFGRALNDADITAFVDDIDFNDHWLVGAFSFDQRLIGFAHACPVRAGRQCTVYAAISVDSAYRGRGIGRALLGMIVDRLHQAAATTVVAIGSCFELPVDEPLGEFADRGAHAYDICTGVRIEAEPLPPGRAYRDTLAQLRA